MMDNTPHMLEKLIAAQARIETILNHLIEKVDDLEQRVRDIELAYAKSKGVIAVVSILGGAACTLAVQYVVQIIKLH